MLVLNSCAFSTDQLLKSDDSGSTPPVHGSALKADYRGAIHQKIFYPHTQHVQRYNLSAQTTKKVTHKVARCVQIFTLTPSSHPTLPLFVLTLKSGARKKMQD